jgi:transposase
MAKVCEHLSVAELEERYVGCRDATAARLFQVIWLSARGHTISQVSATTAFGARWIEQLLARYNTEGPEALGDLRRRNGASATILKPELLAKLRGRLRAPPPDGGLWSSRKVADWGELGLKSVAPQRGWRAESRVARQSEAFRASGLSAAAKARQALKAIFWSIQAPRPKNPKSAIPPPAIPSSYARLG